MDRFIDSYTTRLQFFFATVASAVRDHHYMMKQIETILQSSMIARLLICPSTVFVSLGVFDPCRVFSFSLSPSSHNPEIAAATKSIK